MNMKKIGLCSLFLLGALLLSSEARQPKNYESSKRVTLERDQLLFLEGANALSIGRYDDAIILLNTMRWTYSDSPLIDEAKVLVFYSYARQGGPKNEVKTRLLQEIQRIIEEDDHKTERLFKSPQ